MILSFPANTSHLEKLGEFLKSLCGGHPKLMAIELAVTEIVVNAIKHGEASFCTVKVTDKRDTCYIVVEDNGAAFNPLESSILPLGELRGGGYGIAIVQQVTDHLCYNYSHKYNKLTLKFRNSLTNSGG